MTNDNDRVMLTPQGLFVTMFLDLGYPLDVALAYWNTFDNDLAMHDYIIVREDEAREPTAAEVEAAISRAIAQQGRYRPEHETVTNITAEPLADHQNRAKPCLTCGQCRRCKKTAAECHRYSVWLSAVWQSTTAELRITAHTVRPKFRFKLVYPN